MLAKIGGVSLAIGVASLLLISTNIFPVGPCTDWPGALCLLGVLVGLPTGVVCLGIEWMRILAASPKGDPLNVSKS
jgi:hypothetical protein